MKTETKDLLTEIATQAADDYVEGFKNCYRAFGLDFLKEGFATRLDVPEGRTVDVNKYVVSKTGMLMPKSLCVFFDARDFFLGNFFKQLFDEVDGNKIVEALNEKARHELRNRRVEKRASEGRSVIIDVDSKPAA